MATTAPQDTTATPAPDTMAAPPTRTDRDRPLK